MNPIDQLLELFVFPEMNRRLELGTLSQEFFTDQKTPEGHNVLKAPHTTLVLIEDARDPTVLFNGEVPIEYKGRVAKELAAPGSVIGTENIEVLGFRFGSIPQNAAWIWILNENGKFRYAYDLRRNGAIARRHLKHANQFLSSASLSSRRVATENLFHAVEKAGKAELLLLPLELRSKSGDQVAWKSHLEIAKLYNNLGQSVQGKKLITKLTRLRRSATYHLSPFRLSNAELQEIILEVRSFIENVRRRIPKQRESCKEYKFCS